MAKRIIALINAVGQVINNDVNARQSLRVIFVPNYSVSLAELIVPATDVSEQISTAGTEASGTGNMKFALNGALTIGTLDGENIEIRDNVGAENIFIFGHTAEEVARIKANGYDPARYYEENGTLRQALDQIVSGYFCPEEAHRYQPIFDALVRHGDHYL